MTRRRSIRLDALAVMFVFLGVELLAEQEPVAPAGPAQSRSSLSPRITQEVRAKLPKFKASGAARPDGSVSTTEASESPDGTLVLPTITVTETIVIPPESAVITSKGRLEQAMKANPGLKLGNLFGLNSGIALAMQREERLAGKRAALRDLVQRTVLIDTPEARNVRGLMNSATSQPNADWQAGRR